MSDQSKSVSQRIIESLQQFTEELEHDDSPVSRRIKSRIKMFSNDLIRRQTEPAEAFPWFEGDEPDKVVDANGNSVCFFFGWGGHVSDGSPGVAERVRMVLELPAMLDLLHAIAAFNDSGHARSAREILARIEGASK